MIGFVFQLSATGVAQSVKIEKQLQSLETVFEQVESQTGLLIMFSNNELDVNRKVSLDIRKYTLEELFRKVLEGTNMDFDLEQNYVVIRPARPVAVRDSVVKTNQIKGVVVDARGEPLPGVPLWPNAGRFSLQERLPTGVVGLRSWFRLIFENFLSLSWGIKLRLFR